MIVFFRKWNEMLDGHFCCVFKSVMLNGGFCLSWFARVEKGSGILAVKFWWLLGSWDEYFKWALFFGLLRLFSNASVLNSYCQVFDRWSQWVILCIQALDHMLHSLSAEAFIDVAINFQLFIYIILCLHCWAKLL